MSRILLLTVTLALLRPCTAGAQGRWQIELLGDGAIATQKLADASLGTGFGFEGSGGFRIRPHLWVYAGWDWHRFSSGASFAGTNTDFEETGWALGLRFEHQIEPSGPFSLRLRAGGTYNHVEIEGPSEDRITNSGHGLGWEAGGGIGYRLDDRWRLISGARFRSLARTFTVGGVRARGHLQYLAFALGLSWGL